jgi:RNA polymerase sigma-70 factor, ECF subfamily
MVASVEMQFEGLSLPGATSAEGVDDSDPPLVRAAQNGDRSAFGALYQRYVRMVHGILLARVPRAAAEDLVQDVFLQALPRLSSLRDATRFGGWLAVIARNRANDYYRQKGPATQCEDEFCKDSGAGARPRLGQLEDGLFLLEAIRSLPETYREPLILRFVEGMTGPEIAARTGMKHGSVRVNLHRGMQMLRERIGRE